MKRILDRLKTLEDTVDKQLETNFNRLERELAEEKQKSSELRQIKLQPSINLSISGKNHSGLEKNYC